MKRFRWRQLGACPLTCPVCQDAVIHERCRVVVEATRPFRAPIDLPYAEMVRCPNCGHAAMTERGFGDAFRPRPDEEPYDALVRFFGPDHRETSMADAHRNARVDLISNDARWHLIVNAFAHASYEQFVPPVGSLPRRTTLGRLTSYFVGVLILFLVGGLGAGVLVAVLPEAWSDVGNAIITISLVGAFVGMTGWHAWCYWKEWSVEIHRRRSTRRVHRSLARMLRGLDADGSTLRDAKKAALENKWVTAAVDPEKVLELIAADAADRNRRPNPSTRSDPHAAPRKQSEPG